MCAGLVHESLVEGRSTFHEPNQGVDYDVEAHWEGDVFVASRRHPTVNFGRPTVKRLFIDRATGELVNEQAWGGARAFVATFSRR